MRNEFIETITELAEDDDRIMLITADLGWSVVERFADKFPDRFLNVGVSEQNMLGVATGLAQVGFHPFVYSIATFSSMRCYEQIRNGPLLHGLPVRIVGIGGGYAYGHAGPTHHAFEDLAILRCQPEMTVLSPADPAQACESARASQSITGPIYYRIGKGRNPTIDGLDGRFQLDAPEVVRDGRDILFLATGTIASECVAAAEQLSQSGVSAAVAVQAHLPHAPTKQLAQLLVAYPRVITVEEAYRTGGLGSLAAETITEYGLSCQLKICGVRTLSWDQIGSTAHMNSLNGLDVESLCAAAETLSMRPKAA